MFCYDTEYLGQYLSHVFKTYLPISKPIFSPKCDIIFNYSEKKRRFLEERNIPLPTIEETYDLYYEMKEGFKNKNKPYMQNLIEKLDQSIKKYETIQLNMTLKNELQIKNNTKRKVKV